MQKATFSLFSRGNPARKVGTVSFFGKSWKGAQQAGERYLRKLGLRSNVAAGFWDDSGFHPTRASYDYDPSRVGEQKRARRHRRTRATTRRAGFRGRVHNKRLNFGERMARLRKRRQR